MSSTIYFGFPASGAKGTKVNVSTQLKDRGIDLLRAPPSNVLVIAQPTIVSSIWNTVIAHLSALIYSVSAEEETSLNQTGYWITAVHDDPLPIPFPDLAITVLNRSQEAVDWLIDNGFEEQNIRSESTWLLNAPTNTLLQSLTADRCPVKFKHTNYAPYGYSNFAAIQEFSMMRNILSYLLQLIAVPVFDTEIIPENFLDTSPEDDGEDDDEEDPHSRIAVNQAAAMAMSNRCPYSKLFQWVRTQVTSPLPRDKGDATRCSERNSYYAVDDFSAANLGAGILLRYVEDLASEDPAGVPNFFSKYCMRSLGDDFSEQAALFSELKSSWGVLKTTRSGHILSHLVKCLEISMSANCGIKAIFDNGIYEGCVLQGYGYTLSTHSKIYSPSTSDDLYEDISALDTHSKMQDEILNALRVGGVDIGDIPDSLDSMNDLRMLLLQARLNETQKKDIRESAVKLRFRYRKWSINLGSITKLLSTLQEGVSSISDDYPIGPEALFSNDPVEIAMSCFPSDGCPSFRHPSGVPIDLRAKKAPVPPQSTTARGGKNPGQVNNGGWIFSVRRVAYTEAVADFRLMIHESEARSMGAAASKGLGYFVLSGGNFEKVFLQLRELAQRYRDGQSSGVNSELKNTNLLGAKRVASAEVPRPGTSKKSRAFF